MLLLVHEVPGRLRLRTPQVSNQLQHALTLKEKAYSLPGVTHVHTNALTGSVVVYYDPRTASRDDIVNALGASSLQPPQPQNGELGPAIFSAVGGAALEQLLAHAARALVAAVI